VARAGRANSRIDRIILAACAALSLVGIVLPMQVRESIASVLRQTVLAPMVVLQERSELSRRAFLEHDAKMRTRDSIAQKAMTAVSLESENQRLREIIGLGSRLTWGFVPAEALHGRGVRDETSITLSAGSRAGVARMSPVVAPEGLVGMVESVDPTMSQAQLWTNAEFRVSAMSEDATAFGIVQAHTGNGVGSYLMEMRGVPFRTSIKPGTMIVSSGLGGVYPRGIPIGRVINEIKTVETWAQTYLIRPAVFPSDVYSVMILRPERVSEGVNNVWAVGNISDSTVRRIVVAGDSMARTAALAESQAREAAADSLRQDSLRKAGIVPGVVPGVPGQGVPAPTPAPQTVPAPGQADSARPPRRAPNRAPARRDTNNLPTTI
jgi:rod shape-determining protein MreC